MVKIYRKNELCPELIQMVKDEIFLFKTLDHPNIAKLIELIEDEHKLYVVLDSCRGTSLFMHVMDSGELPESDCSVIAAQIVSIMRYLHKKHIMIRNLSMNTLAFGEPGLITDVKLIDLLFAIKTFNLAKEAPNRIDEQIY